MIIYIYAQRRQPFCQPHGQKVSQGCGDVLSSEITTHTRGWTRWNQNFYHNNPHRWWARRDSTNCGSRMCTKHRHVTVTLHLTWLIMHKDGSPFVNHTAKRLVRVVVTYCHLKSPHTPAGGRDEIRIFTTTTQFAVSQMEAKRNHTTLPLTVLWRAICNIFPFPQEELKLRGCTVLVLISY